jgi:TetR/AcrR family transcriptional repressor of mexJK operon
MLDAARTLFLREGYAGTTMEEIAALAGLTKRTLYNNFADKDALFTQIFADVIAYVEEFARSVRGEFNAEVTSKNLRVMLDNLGQRLASTILRPDVVALRRLLIGEARALPSIAREYFDRGPAQVIEAMAAGFAALGKSELLKVTDPRRAAAQFAYLVVGEPLDRAMLVGVAPPAAVVVACAREGVETFWARYGNKRR